MKESRMQPHAYDVDVADFDEKVIAASHRTLVLVDFWAAWCQPCRILKPVLEKLAAEFAGRFVLAKVNSDECQALAQRYGVRGIPAVKAFLNGQVVDEFTGALPEAQVREFLARALPSLAEPMRLEALEARARGDAEAARKLLARAIEADPGNELARIDLAETLLSDNALDEAQRVLEAISGKGKDGKRLEALRAKVEFSRAAAGADIAALKTAVAADPNDLEARLTLAKALALVEDYRPALENLLEIVRLNRSWRDAAGRKTMIALFGLLDSQSGHDGLVREFRLALARTLN